MTTMVALSPRQSPSSRSSDDHHDDDDRIGNILSPTSASAPTINRRQLLVRVGSWMKYSWRKSQNSLMSNNTMSSKDNIDLEDDIDDEINSNQKIPKHVHFYPDNQDNDENDDVGELIVTEMPCITTDEPLSEEEEKEIWFQDYDYKRFEKDRVLTTLDYTNARRLNRTFEEEKHSIRGLETNIDSSLSKRQIGERKDLYKAVKEEEIRQKVEGIFPDLDKFRVISLKHTKPGKDRAIIKATEDAKEQLKQMKRSVSMKNLLFRRTIRGGPNSTTNTSSINENVPSSDDGGVMKEQPRRRQSIS